MTWCKIKNTSGQFQNMTLVQSTHYLLGHDHTMIKISSKIATLRSKSKYYFSVKVRPQGQDQTMTAV